MVITYQGDNYFKFQVGDTAILLDPTDQRSFKGANIVLNTQRPAPTDRPDEGERGVFWIDHQGEYEVEGIRIRGWQADWKEEVEKTIYRVDFSDLRLVFLGFLEKEPTSEIFEYLEDVDIAVVPVGSGDDIIPPSEVAKLLRQIEPSLIIPALTGKKQDLDKLLGEFNQDSCSKEEKITLTSRDLKAGAMEIRCLKS